MPCATTLSMVEETVACSKQHGRSDRRRHVRKAPAQLQLVTLVKFAAGHRHPQVSLELSSHACSYSTYSSRVLSWHGLEPGVVRSSTTGSLAPGVLALVRWGYTVHSSSWTVIANPAVNSICFYKCSSTCRPWSVYCARG